MLILRKGGGPNIDNTGWRGDFNAQKWAKMTMFALKIAERGQKGLILTVKMPFFESSVV